MHSCNRHRLGSRMPYLQYFFDITSVLLLLILLTAGPPFASAQNSQERAKQLLEDALTKLGGQSFLKIQSIKRTGRAYSFYRYNLRGLAVMTLFDGFEELQENKDSNWLPVSRREVYTPKGNYYTLFKNGQGWEVTYLGARPLPEDTLHKYRVATRRDIFFILRYRLNNPDMYYYYAGTEIIDNTPTYAVDITDGNSETVTVYFRMSDNLPVQQLYIRRDPKTRIPYEEKAIYSKYRKVASVTLPWNIQMQRDNEKFFEFFGRKIEVNSRLKPDVFSLEKEIKILPPMK